ncbi:MAG: DNA-processing protein DprA [Anaerovoracaceae bacterium]
MNYKILEFNDEKYPEMLKRIKNPPKRIFYIGNIQLLNTVSVAVVGSRKTSDYGFWVASNVARRLAENNVTVVGGMAKGIDTFAHRAALKAGGNTIAVLGTGIDKCFPSENKGLMDEIAKKGLIISEYPPGYPGDKWTFPQRNRIISGISKAVIIGEAGLHSGALITAEWAEEQNKYLFAVPGNINNIRNIGNNKLISDGVMPLTVIDDIFEYIGVAPKEVDVEKIYLGNDERKVLEIIKQHGELSINELCMKLEMKPSIVNGIVSILEIKGIANTSLGKIFIAK